MGYYIKLFENNRPDFFIKLSSRKVEVSPEGVAKFKSKWAGSKLDSENDYWFEFDSDGNLIDTSVPARQDDYGVSILANDCRDWLFDDKIPEWFGE